MTTMILTIDDKSQDLVEALKTIVSNFQGVSFEIDKEESTEDVLNSFSASLQDIKNGNSLKNARPIEELYKEFSNDQNWVLPKFS